MHDEHLEDDEVTNVSGNRPFDDVLQARISRRGAVVGSAATMAAVFWAGTGVAGAETEQLDGDVSAEHRRRNRDRIDFKPVPNADAFGPEPSISDDYEYQVMIPWGTPIQPDGPEFSWPQTAASDQEQQIGIGHDGMWFFETGHDRGFLCLNHEFGRTTHVLGKALPESAEDVRIMQAAHGISVVKIRNKRNGGWQRVRSNKNRRITVNTPVKFSGPVAKSHLLETKAGNGPAGTLNNCANGYTPWGTYLTCEENFNGYFGATGDWTPTPAQERYGFSETGFGYGWEAYDPRFDLSNGGLRQRGESLWVDR